jgi:hypothetical protein
VSALATRGTSGPGAGRSTTAARSGSARSGSAAAAACISAGAAPSTAAAVIRTSRGPAGVRDAEDEPDQDRGILPTHGSSRSNGRASGKSAETQHVLHGHQGLVPDRSIS